MTKYQIAQFKRAVKRDLTKEKFNHKAEKVVYTFPKQEERKLPDYITNNPWY
jgi:hypothetical protein